MLELMTLEGAKKRVATILTTDESEMSTERCQTLILDAMRFYGASITLQNKLPYKPSIRLALKASKSWCDEYLERKHGVSRYWAHSATNACTHYNLLPVDMSDADMSEFAGEAFYQYYVGQMVTG